MEVACCTGKKNQQKNEKKELIKEKHTSGPNNASKHVVWAVKCIGGLGLEQALALVWEPDIFAEGAWDKLTKTEGTFNFKLPSQFYLYLLKILLVQFIYIC